jgi:hypothetical protein
VGNAHLNLGRISGVAESEYDSQFFTLERKFKKLIAKSYELRTVLLSVSYFKSATPKLWQQI